MTMSREDWAVRASAWELAALTFRHPEAALAQAVASGEWADAAEELAAALGAELPASFAEDARANAGGDADALLHALCAEATHLFVGAPDPVANAYEGMWRAEDDGVQALLFVNPHSMDVERFCRACGLGRPKGTNEPLDHVATEAELLQYLAALAAGIAQPVETSPELGDLPGGSPAGAYARFFEEHACVWMPRFAQKTAEESRIPFFRAAGAFLAAVAGRACHAEGADR